MKRIPDSIKMEVIAKLNANLTEREIVKELKVSKGYVAKVAKEISHTSANRAGRKPILSGTTKRHIVLKFKTGGYATATAAAKAIAPVVKTKVSPETVRNALREASFNSKRKPKALPLNAQRKKARLQFARKYKDWTVHDWQRVIYSDETKINRFGSDGKQWTWVQEGTALQDHNVNQVYKHGGGSIFLWGCITAEGPGNLVKIDGGLDSALYCQILAEDLLGTLAYYQISKDRIYLLHDNDPKHRSRMTQEWLKRNEVKVIDWPAYSPDLNPIENMWYFVKCELAKYDEPPKGMLELWERVEHIWNNKIDKDMCLRYINSMPERIQAVIKAKGGETKY
jgi:transposase